MVSVTGIMGHVERECLTGTGYVKRASWRNKILAEANCGSQSIQAEGYSCRTSETREMTLGN